MTEPIFFEIPIYRCSRDKHTTEMEELENKVVPKTMQEPYPQSYQNMKNHFDKAMWYPWQYNEIIGYLNLYILGSQFRADEWFVTKQRINKGINKKSIYMQGR